MNTRTTGSILGFILLSILLGACAPGESVDIPTTGEMVRTDFDLSGFQAIAVEDFFEAEIKQGPVFSVRVECEEALVPFLRVEVRGDQLRVGLDPSNTYSFEEASQRVEVTVPALVFVRAQKHSSVQLVSFKVDEMLELKLLDFSALTGEIDANDVHIEISNHSTLTLDGSADKIGGEVTGMSTANLSSLSSTAIDVEVDEKSSLRP